MGNIPTICEYLAHLRHEGRAASTIATYGTLLRRLDRDLPHGLVYACTDELRDAINLEHRRPASRALYRAAVVDFFGWCCDPAAPRLDFDPSRYLPRQPVPRRAARPAPSDELADILARAAAPFLTWYLLAAGNGLRCCEISALDRQHVTAESMWIHGKGGKERTVPTHPAVWAAVRGLPGGPVARTPDGRRRADRRSVGGRANRHLQVTLGHVGVTMHRLRHWHGTHVHVAAGYDWGVVQELLGHANLNTTRIYVATVGGRKAAAIGGLALPRVSSSAGDGAAAA